MKQVKIPENDWLTTFQKQINDDGKNNLGKYIPNQFDRYLKILHSAFFDKTISTTKSWDNVLKNENAQNIALEEIKSFDDIITSATIVSVGTPDDLIENRKNYQRVLWKDLAKKLNIEFKNTINPSVFIKHFGGSLPANLYGFQDGSFNEIETETLIKVLQNTIGKQICYFDFDWLKALNFEVEVLNINQTVYRYSGSINEINEFHNFEDDRFTTFSLPTYIWNESKDFLIWSDADLAFTFICCNNHIADQILKSDLECIEISRDLELANAAYWE